MGLELTKEELESFKCNTNYLLVKPDLDAANKIDLSGGVKLFLDTSYEKEKHAATTGTVISVCNDLYFNKDSDYKKSVRYDTSVEIEKGDKIYFHYLTMINADKEKRIYTHEGEYYVIMKYDSIFCLKRGDEVKMVNGWILLEPIEVEAEKTRFIEVPEFKKKKHSAKIARVVHVGLPCLGYYEEKNIYDANTKVSPGDVVFYDPHSDIPLQYDFKADLDGKKKFFRMQRKDIIGLAPESTLEDYLAITQ